MENKIFRLFVLEIKDEPEIGDRMEDGTVYAGKSPDTGKPLYVTPHDAPLAMTWDDAINYVHDLDAHGHIDWRLPTKNELKMLSAHRNRGLLKDTFNESGAPIEGWYWTSCQESEELTWYQRRTFCQMSDQFAWHQRFADDDDGWGLKVEPASARPVRSETYKSFLGRLKPKNWHLRV